MKDASIRLFETPWLDRLTHVSPYTVALLWSGVIGGLWGLAIADHDFQMVPALGLALSGWAVWTLFEYALHRWVFHWRPGHPALKRLVFMMHGVHHAQPNDGSRVVMPPLASVPLAVILWGLAGLILAGSWRDAFFAGFLTGYLHYDITHWACHQVRFRSDLGRRIQRRHLRHHHTAPDRNFGVGSPLWDHVFGTVLGRTSARP